MDIKRLGSHSHSIVAPTLPMLAVQVLTYSTTGYLPTCVPVCKLGSMMLALTEPIKPCHVEGIRKTGVP